MKKLILSALLSLSSTAFANYCQVEMIDLRTNGYITSFTSYDDYDACKESMKACRLEIRKRGMLNRADCIRTSDSRPTPFPQPIPNPRPIPNPQPWPQPQPQPGSYDARRMININENVIYNNSYVTVLGSSMNGLFAVRDSSYRVINGVSRQMLSVTNGCNLGLCVNDSVIDTYTNSYVTLVGLSTNDTFVSRDSSYRLQSNVNRMNLAETKGCASSRWAQVCVGNTVIDTRNQYSTVVGIQLNGLVVLRDSSYRLQSNVDPGNLVITR